MDWMRRWLGESAALSELRAENTRLSAANARLKARNVRLRTKNAQLANTFHRLLEPPQSIACDKVRLRDQMEAEQFARRLEVDLGLPVGTFVGYRCRFCPRHPVSSNRFWHVTHADPAQRGQQGRHHQRRSRGIGRTHLDPAVIQKLRESTGGAA